MTEGAEVPEEVIQPDRAQQAVDTATQSDIPDPDEILEDPEVTSEAGRLREEAFDVLDTLPGYRDALVQWARTENTAIGNYIEPAFPHGNKVLGVRIFNGPRGMSDNFNVLEVKVFPQNTALSEVGRLNSERYFWLHVPLQEGEHPKIYWHDNTPSADIKNAENTRRAITKIEGLIGDIKTGFAEPEAPPPPETPTS